ncbi:MAG: glycoside hydrolase N-terminal domain-containing protein [Bacteroidaceae bacterium]|nr:glycoside hydrolase N-terminal domain-containing protein [Bacteroidaceae bacterium]
MNFRLSILTFLSIVCAVIGHAQTVTLPASTQSEAYRLSSQSFDVSYLGGIGTDTIYWRTTSADSTASRPMTVEGTLSLTFPGLRTADEYENVIDTLANTAHTNVTYGNLHMERQLFVYEKHRTLVLHLQAEEEGRPLNFIVGLSREKTSTSQDSMYVRGSGIAYIDRDSTEVSAVMMYVKTDADGAAVAVDGGIRVIDTHEATIYLVAQRKPIPAQHSSSALEARHDRTVHRLVRDLIIDLHRTALKPYARLRKAHLKTLASRK